MTNNYEKETIQKVISLLSEIGNSAKNYLADYVSSMCNVPIEDLMRDTKHIDVVKARWFYWYAYRYMTNESFDSIARMATKDGRKFTTSCVGSGCAKISSIIEREPLWNKRWQMVKTIIKSLFKTNDKEQDQQKELVVKIIYPTNVKIELKQEKL